MQDKSTKTVFFIGRPGSGKGTQAKILAQTLNWQVFSSGGQLKTLIDGAGPLSERIREDYESGKLAPDWFAIYLFEHAILNLPPESGIVYEGFPRSLPQAEIADNVFEWLERPYKVINLEVSEDECMKRQLSRAQVEHRPDSDAEHKIRARFDTYTDNTVPALEYFRKKGVVIEVDGEQTPEKIAEDIKGLLGM